MQRCDPLSRVISALADLAQFSEQLSNNHQHTPTQPTKNFNRTRSPTFLQPFEPQFVISVVDGKTRRSSSSSRNKQKNIAKIYKCRVLIAKISAVIVNCRRSRTNESRDRCVSNFEGEKNAQKWSAGVDFWGIVEKFFFLVYENRPTFRWNRAWILRIRTVSHSREGSLW